MAQNGTFNLFFLGLGWPWVGEFRRFHNGTYMFCNPTEFGTSTLQTPYSYRKKKKKEMLPTIQQRTQVDGSHEYPAVVVLVPFNSDSLYTLF